MSTPEAPGPGPEPSRRLIPPEVQYAAVLNSALDCIVTIDDQGCVLEFNAAAERTFGYRAEEVLGREIADVIIPPNLRARHHEAFARYLRTGQTRLLERRFETVGMRADRTEFPVELTITRMQVPGRPVIMGFLRDITERKRAEEALRASEARFRALFEAMEEGVALHEVVLDANGKLVDYVIVDVNPAYERITGISRERAAGRRASELYGSGSPPYLEEFGGVGVTGVPRHMVTHFAPMNKTFSISITCLGPGQFATVFVEVHGEGPAGLV